MSNKIAIVVLAIAMPCISFGQDAGSYQCSFGELKRRVEILTEPGVSVPCEVHYYKDTEAPGDRQVLWSASSEAGYCEKKTEEFIAKLESWGWDCGGGSTIGGTNGSASGSTSGSMTITKVVAESTEEAEAESDQADDTDALAPVEEAAMSDEQ